MSPEKLGRYDLTRMLGKGAMGLVYEGRDPNLDRRVAIKTIRVDNLSEQAAADYEHRFRVEARSAARLQHPNIVSVYDAGRDGDIAFLVMEFIQGEDLKHHLDQGLRHSLSQTVAIMEDLLSALDYAHGQGIVHRDIKPANLLIEADGRVKLTDFGVARILDSGDATRTQGTMVGTLKYMSPEQVQGLPVDARADLFAAGIVLYQLLTGKRPFDGDSDFAIIRQVVGHSPAVPSALNPDLPLAIDAVVATALAKSRDRRYVSAQAFAAALRAASRDAADPAIIPPVSQPSTAGNSSATGIEAPGEALVGLQSDIGLNLSALTQEVELVYWKDIKESPDVEDIHGFLAKFPAGIYADLALRRLRKLGVQTGQDCNDASGAGISATGTWAMSQQATQADRTIYIARNDELRPEAAASDGPPDGLQRGEATMVLRPAQAPAAITLSMPPAATGPQVQAVAAAASRAVDPIAIGDVGLSASHGSASAPMAAKAEGRELPTGQGHRSAPVLRDSSRARWRFRALLGVALLAAFGLGAKVFWPVSEAPIPQAAALSDRESILVAALPAGAAGVAPLALDAARVPAAAASEASEVALPEVGIPPEAAKPASEKKTVNKKRMASRTRPVLPPLTGSARAEVVPVPAQAAAAPRVSSSNNPKQLCEDRVLIGFQLCMAEQCSKPAFAGHPQCVERRVMDQRRREENRNH